MTKRMNHKRLDELKEFDPADLNDEEFEILWDEFHERLKNFRKHPFCAHVSYVTIFDLDDMCKRYQEENDPKNWEHA